MSRSSSLASPQLQANAPPMTSSSAAAATEEAVEHETPSALSLYQKTPPTKTTTTTTTTTTALSGKAGVCSIEVTYVEWVWQQPWQRCKQAKCEGSGFVISNRRILTNAHVVASAIDIRIRLHGSPRRFPGHVAVYAPDVDLAIVSIRPDLADEFFGGNNNNNPTDDLALELSDTLPALQDRVHVLGFPTGGRTICVTEGVVSRIDDLPLAAPSDTILVIQIDAAINPGNSGGPALNGQGQVTGVAFCKSSDGTDDNIGYVIPSNVVRAFLGRCHPENGTYTLSPSVPYRWHSLENRSLRYYHKVPDHVHGVLLTDVSPTVPFLQKYDVLTHIDDSALADDGQVVLRHEELIQHRHLLRGKHVHETTVFTVYRNGQPLRSEPVSLSDIPNICKRWVDVDHKPDYLVLGALVFLPLSYSLMTSSHAPVRLQGTFTTWTKQWPGSWGELDGLVVLTSIFAHELSFAYERPWRLVKSYNGIPVKSLVHLRDMWNETRQQVTNQKKQQQAAAVADSTTADVTSTPAVSMERTFVRIELEDDDDIVFDVQAAMDAQAEILETHQIPTECVICPPDPRYAT